MKTILPLILLTLGLAACNTIEGVGEDVSATGDVISDTAEDTKNDL